MKRQLSAVILKITPLGLVAEYVLFTSLFTPLDNTSPLDLSREVLGAIVSLDLDGVGPCNNGHRQGSRRERETDRTGHKVRELHLQVRGTNHFVRSADC